MLLKQFNTTNNLLDANRYLAVKDSRHARWAGFFGAGLFVVSVFIWFVPPMAARILFPDLHAVSPTLKNPEEASFIANCPGGPAGRHDGADRQWNFRRHDVVDGLRPE